MFVWGNTIAIAALLMGVNARAADPAPKLYADISAAGHYQIRVIPAKECEKLLVDTLYPSEVIKRGVSAIAGLAENQPSPTDCLEHTLAQWETEIPPPEFKLAPESVTSPPPSISRELARAIAQLTIKKSCFEGKKYLCKEGPPVTGPEYEQILKDLKAKRQQFTRVRAALSDLSALLLPPPQIDNRPQKALAQRLVSCEQDFAEKTDDRQWKCGQETLGAAEHEALEKQAEKENGKIYQQEVAYRETKTELEDELSRIFATRPELWAKAQAFHETIKCTNPYGEHNGLADEFRPPADCQASATPADVAKARKRAEALLGNGSKILAEGERRRKDLADRIFRSTAKLNSVRNFNYNLRALLARFESFLHQGGKPENLATFCATNEREQLRDFAFQPVSQKLGTTSVTYGTDDRFLAAAKRYGLTEGEISAIHSFTGSFYNRINRAILQDGMTPDLGTYKGLLETALAKLPAYQAGPLKRFVTFPEEVLKEHKVGNVVCYKSFSSTSKNPDWQWGAKHELLIYPGVKGKDVSKLSASESEGEVLFTANSCFKVLSAEGTSKFVLGEVDQSGKVIAKLPAKEQP